MEHPVATNLASPPRSARPRPPRSVYWSWSAGPETVEEALPPIDVVSGTIDFGTGSRSVGHYLMPRFGRGPKRHASVPWWLPTVPRLRSSMRREWREVNAFVALCESRPLDALRACQGYGIAVLSVVIEMLYLHLVRFRIGMDDLSVLSQFVVLGVFSVLLIAIKFGARPAALNGVLLFVAYEFVLESHVRHATMVMILCPFLAIAGAFGYYAARERAAKETLQREKDHLRRLLETTRLVVDAPRTDDVLSQLCDHLLSVVRPAGVETVALLLQDEHGRFVTLQMKPENPPSAATVDGERMPHRALAEARCAYHRHSVTALTIDNAALRTVTSSATFYVPLRIPAKQENAEKIIGILALVGVWDTALLAYLLGCSGPSQDDAQRLGVDLRVDLELTRALCDHIASVLYRRRLEQQMVRASVENDTMHVKSRFLVFIAHALRSPAEEMLAVIDDYRRAAGTILVEGRGKEVIATLRRHAAGLERLANNAFELVKLEEGEYKPQLELHRLDELISEIVKKLSPTSRKRIQLDFAPNLPFVRADAELIEMLLRNLIENAFQHSPSHLPVQIAVQAHTAPGAVSDHYSTATIVVKDQGCGIREDDLEHIFVKWVSFDYAPPSGRRRKGNGLGLPICRMIASKHDGEIHAESELGHGATFVLTLPVPPQPPPNALPDI